MAESTTCKRRLLGIAGSVAGLAVAVALGCGPALSGGQALATSTAGTSSATSAADASPSSSTASDKQAKTGASATPSSSTSAATAAIPKENATCTACHAAEDEAAQDATTVAGMHAAITCATCHDDTETLDKLHATTKAKRMPLRLKKTSVEDATCLTCHDAEPGSEEFLALSAASSLVDANGLEVNPHAMVGAEGHEGITCTSCHETHDDSEPATRAQKVCATCHHANVYACFTCHEHG